MSVTVIVFTAVVAASVGYFVSRRRGAKAEFVEKNATVQKTVKAALPAPSPASGFGVELGDVISSGGDERWLSGVIVARDHSAVAALFFAPEGREHYVVAAFPLPDRDVHWLRPVEVVSPAEPPGTLEIDGLTMHRKSRVPVTFERIGQGAPDVGSSGMLATYHAGARDVAMVITSGDSCFAWSGRRMDSTEYDRMGKSLEE